MIVLYGFVEGDTMGLLVFAHDHETVGEVTAKLRAAASVRVEPRDGARLVHQGRVLDPSLKVGESGLMHLDRVDLVGADAAARVETPSGAA